MATILDGGAWGWVGYLTVARNVPITIPRSSRVTTVRDCLWAQDAGTSGTEARSRGRTVGEETPDVDVAEGESEVDRDRKTPTKYRVDRTVQYGGRGRGRCCPTVDGDPQVLSLPLLAQMMADVSPAEGNALVGQGDDV